MSFDAKLTKNTVYVFYDQKSTKTLLAKNKKRTKTVQFNFITQ